MAQFFRGGFSSIPPVTKNLIIINALIWLVEVIWPQFGQNGILRHCGLQYIASSQFNPAQLITYMFVHDPHTFFHVFFNMLTLFFFGPALENIWGARRFLFYYMICGVGAALIQEGVFALEWHHIYTSWETDYIRQLAAFNHIDIGAAREFFNQGLERHDPELMKMIQMVKDNSYPPVVGASGAIFGILLGFAFVFPNVPMFLFFIPVPIKAKYMVAGYAVIEFFAGITGSLDLVAHFAHLGGMLFGLGLLLWWKHKGTLTGNRYGF